jgi:hypothetical protein
VIALVGGALVLLIAMAVGGWFFFARKAEPTVATASAAPTFPAESAPPGGAAVEPTTLAPAPASQTAAPAIQPVPVPVPARPGGAATSNPPPVRTAATQPPPANPAPRAAASSEYVFLDEEAAEGDGREAGERLAGTYRQGGGTTPSGTFGASGRFKARERSPRSLAPEERPAVATIRHLIDRMEAYQRKEGRYAGLAELRAAGLALDVPVSGNAFQRRGFRFEVTVEADGFRVTATPVSPSGRSFVGDDSGYIRAGVD